MNNEEEQKEMTRASDPAKKLRTVALFDTGCGRHSPMRAFLEHQAWILLLRRVGLKKLPVAGLHF